MLPLLFPVHPTPSPSSPSAGLLVLFLGETSLTVFSHYGHRFRLSDSVSPPQNRRKWYRWERGTRDGVRGARGSAHRTTYFVGLISYLHELQTFDEQTRRACDPVCETGGGVFGQLMARRAGPLEGGVRANRGRPVSGPFNPITEKTCFFIRIEIVLKIGKRFLGLVMSHLKYRLERIARRDVWMDVRR